ncbi:MAG: DUF1501 domain-containing protein [Pseudomonadota bacterium]
MPLTRRQFLSNSAASSLALASLSGVGQALCGFDAHAAQSNDYKALVCVFLFGGLDCHDTVLPYDQASYDQFASLRSSLFQAQGTARARENLLPLTTQDPAQFGARRYALPPELAGLKALYDQGNAAIIGNVGPLLQATDRLSFEQESVPLPARLFSHNDQQATWQASAPEGALFGWGGRFADALLAGNGSPEFSAISSIGDGLFLSGQTAQPYNISPQGAARIELLEEFEILAQESGNTAPLQAVRSVLRNEQYKGSNLFGLDMANAHRDAIDSNTLYNAALLSAQPLTTAFPASPLGAQLRAVAQSISVRSGLQANRQVFFVGLGGFDTHSAQATSLPGLLTQIDGAVSAFQAEMIAQGLSQQVTLFTASDFGRTLAVNGDGTDHGWGGHHFVVGGAVQGGAIYGRLPPATLGHDQDSGSGRLIPTTAVEELAAPLGRWFGLSNADLGQALPNLSNFSASPVLPFI